MTNSRFRTRLALVTAGALALRVGYVLVARRHAPVGGDAVSYHVGANLLAHGKGFIDPLRYELAGLHLPSAYHPPLYTGYLAAWSWLGFEGPLAHRLASCLLGAATVALVGLVGRRLAGERAGLAAAVLAALYPHLWLNDGALLSETATAFAVALALLTIERFRTAPSVRSSVLLGGAFALAVLGRAELALLFPLVALPLVLGRRELSMRDRTRRLAGCAGVALVLLGPWVGWNLVRFHHPELVSTGFGPTVASASCDGAYYGSRLGYWAASRGCGIAQVQIPAPDAATAARWRADPSGTRAERQGYFRRYLSTDRDAHGRIRDESDADADARKQAWNYTRDHAGRAPVVVLARIGRIWNLYRPWQNARFDGTIEGRGIWPARLALVAYFLYLAGAAAGLWCLRRRHHPVWPYLMLAVVVTVAAGTTFGIQRYRVPVDVALPALAGVALDALWTWSVRRRSSSAATASPMVPVP